MMPNASPPDTAASPSRPGPTGPDGRGRARRPGRLAPRLRRRLAPVPEAALVVALLGAVWLGTPAPAVAAPGPRAPSATPQAAPSDPANTRASAREVASLLELAATEYADAVEDGEVVNAAEYREASTFAEEAAHLFASLRRTADRPGSERIAAAIDSLRSLVRRKAPREAFAEQADRVASGLAEAWGAVAAPEPDRPPSAARGAELYRVACAACHGPAGRGNGWAAEGMEPPPPDLASELRRREATPARDFQVINYGVPETAMPASKDWLSVEEAWDLVAYVQALRFDGAAVAEGEGLALEGGGEGRGESPVADRLRRWSSPAGAARITDPELRRRIQVRWSQATGDTLPTPRAVSVVAYVRTAMGTPRAAMPRPDPSARLAEQVDEADSLATAAADLAEAGESEAARSTALRAYMAFEGVEPELRSRAPDLVRDVEAAFGRLRGSLGGDGRPAGTQAELAGLLDRARQELTSEATTWSLATQSFVILLREGFEAIIIIGAIIAFLLKTGHEERRRDVYWGVATALAASVATAFVLEGVLAAAPASRELLEGVTMLVAVAVLFSVSYWLLSKMQHRKWENYLRGKMQEALGAGSGLALAGVAFLAVYREGVETVIFYQALAGFAEGGLFPIAGGFVVGCVALGVIYVLFTRYGVRVPMRPFFGATSAILYAMAVVFAGSGLRELQEAGVVGTTQLSWAPRMDLLGVYPTAETLAGQGFLLALLGLALWLTFGRGSETPEEGRDVAAAAAGQTTTAGDAPADRAQESAA